MQQKIPAAFVTAGTVPADLTLADEARPEPEHSLDEERPLSSTRQVSWLPAHRLSRAFPSVKDSGISGRLPGYSGASAADSHRFPCSRPLIGRAGLLGLNFAECYQRLHTLSTAAAWEAGRTHSKFMGPRRPSFRRKPESSRASQEASWYLSGVFWTPAFAGVTSGGFRMRLPWPGRLAFRSRWFDQARWCVVPLLLVVGDLGPWSGLFLSAFDYPYEPAYCLLSVLSVCHCCWREFALAQVERAYPVNQC